MQNYSQWLNNKMYQGHVRRLTQIKAKQTNNPVASKKFRIKSQPSKSHINIKKNFFPLPLVSKNERQLLGSVVQQKTMSLRQKQSLLENYMLSKRILETNSVFDSKLLKKQFNFHRKVSDNMSRNLKRNRHTFSQLRKKQFSQLQRCKEQSYLGMGKICFKLKIKEIMLIKRKMQQSNESMYNLKYKPQKFKSFQMKALSFNELIQTWHCLKATEKQANRKNGLKFEIQQVRGNDIHKLCEFRVHLDIHLNKKNIQISESSIHLNPQLITVKNNKLETKEQKEITISQVQKLIHPITKFLIGTIQFTVKYKLTNLQEQ